MGGNIILSFSLNFILKLLVVHYKGSPERRKDTSEDSHEVS